MSTIAHADATPSPLGKGVLVIIGCQMIWGFMPIYWKLLSGVSALLVLDARMIFSGVLMLALAAFVKRMRAGNLLRNPRAIRTFLASGCIISLNWGVYIWATNSGYLLEASFGYYLCPLFTVLFGVFLFGERMTVMQKIALGLACTGVASYVIIQGGMIWISCALALTFSVYAAIKKKGGFDALRGMTFESLITGVLGLAFFALASAFPAIWNATPPSYDALAVSDGTLTCILLVIAGTLTVAPLLLYSAAANDVPFVILGFMQYLSPTISMLVAVFLFGEAFTLAHAICFGLVWIGLAGVGIESVHNFKTAARKTNG